MENFRLKVFRAVARHQNFRIAAEDLLLTQPAVTQQIKALESELDTALFDRSGGPSGRTVTLTPAGLALLPFANRLATLSEEARHAVSSASGSNAGTLTIAASQTISHYVLPRLIAAFVAENPKVSIHTISGNTQAALEAVTVRHAGIALIEGPAMRQDVRVEPFMEDHMVLVVPAGHEWANQTITAVQLQHATFVTRELGSGSRRIVEQALETSGIRLRDLTIRMTFDSTEALLGAVEAGLGIAFVSRWAVRPQLALGTLQLAHVKGLHLGRMFSFATASGPEPIGLIGAFRRFLLQQAAAHTTRPTRKPAKSKSL